MNPWSDVSKSGIDILAIDDNADAVFLIEVKSSGGDGSSAIACEENSLKADFRHLFEGSLEKRILSSTNEMVAYLRVVLERSDLAEKVVDAIGDRPEECTGVRLIGVLVCRGGEQREHNARKRAFQQLRQWLLLEGWEADQCEYRCVELSDFGSWLSKVVEEVTK
jgi:hypothetical protein